MSAPLEKHLTALHLDLLVLECFIERPAKNKISRASCCTILWLLVLFGYFIDSVVAFHLFDALAEMTDILNVVASILYWSSCRW